MIDKTKTDAKLGEEIEAHLKELGINTPTILTEDEARGKDISDDQKDKLTDLFSQALTTLGLDLSDDSLCDTPRRMAKMWIDEVFYGLKPRNFPKLTTVENKMKYDELVIEKDINVQSNCEHHFVVIDGKAYVGYIPKDNVIGLSKINRIVEYFAKRPQIQERLTEQIHATLSYLLKTDDVAVIIDGTHYCVKSRGVEDTCSSTITSRMSGRFRDEECGLRREFLELIKLNK